MAIGDVSAGEQPGDQAAAEQGEARGEPEKPVASNNPARGEPEKPVASNNPFMALQYEEVNEVGIFFF